MSDDERDPVIERFAIRAAHGDNGGEWADHYTEEQKESWRSFVRDMINDAFGTIDAERRELRQQIKGLKDPVLVHANMLRGTIAKPDIRSMLHLHGAEALEQYERGGAAMASAEDDHTEPKEGRVETGVIQFGDDWPGVFIRGDNAFAYAAGLYRLLGDAAISPSSGDLHGPLSRSAVAGLLSLLERSNTQHPEHKVDRKISNG